MFNSKDTVITRVFNPLNVTKSSMMEFNGGELKDTGLYRFKLIVECTVQNVTYTKYIIYSKTDDAEYIFEVFPGNDGSEPETAIYALADTIPFAEDFLEVAGQRFMTTPDGTEYERATMPELDERIDGIGGKARIYNIETAKIEKEFGFKLWEYKRDEDGLTELLNIEMSEEDGMFRIFTGEILEDVFFKFYQTSNE